MVKRKNNTKQKTNVKTIVKTKPNVKTKSNNIKQSQTLANLHKESVINNIKQNKSKNTLLKNLQTDESRMQIDDEDMQDFLKFKQQRQQQRQNNNANGSSLVRLGATAAGIGLLSGVQGASAARVEPDISMFENRLESFDNINSSTVNYSTNAIINEDVNIIRNINPSHDVRLGNELKQAVYNPQSLANDIKSRLPNLLSDHNINKEVKDFIVPNISNEINNMNHLNVIPNGENLFPGTSSVQIIQNEILKGNLKKDEDILKFIQDLRAKESASIVENVVNTEGIFSKTTNSIKNMASNVGSSVKSSLTFAKDATLGTIKTVAGAIIPGPGTALLAAGVAAGGLALAYGGFNYVTELAKSAIKQVNTVNATVEEKFKARQDMEMVERKKKHYHEQMKKESEKTRIRNNMGGPELNKYEYLVDNSRLLKNNETKILSTNETKKDEIVKVVETLNENKEENNKKVDKIEVTIEKTPEIPQKITTVAEAVAVAVAQEAKLPEGITMMSTKLADYINESDKIRNEKHKLEKEMKNLIDVLPKDATGDEIVKKEHIEKINEIIKIGNEMDVECAKETQLCIIKNYSKEKFDKIVNSEEFKKYFIYDGNSNRIIINMANVFSKEEQQEKMKIDFIHAINDCGLLFDKNTGLFYSTEKTDFKQIPMYFSLLSEGELNFNNSKLRRYKYTKFGFNNAQMIVAFNKGIESNEINRDGVRTRFRELSDVWEFIGSLYGWLSANVLSLLTSSLLVNFSKIGLSFFSAGIGGMTAVTLLSLICSYFNQSSDYVKEINELNNELERYYSFINNTQYELKIKLDTSGSLKVEYDLGYAIKTKKLEFKDLSDSNIKDILLDYRNEELNKYGGKTNEGIKELLLLNKKIKEAENFKSEYLKKQNDTGYVNDPKFVNLVEESNRIEQINEKMTNLLQPETKFNTSKENIEAIKEYLSRKWGLYDEKNTLQSNEIGAYGKKLNENELTRDEKIKLANSMNFYSLDNQNKQIKIGGQEILC